MPELETREREIHVRAAVAGDTDERAVAGLAVPYNETITVWGQRERVAPGAVEGDGAKLFERHEHAIGRVVADSDSDAGWEIRGMFSDTARATDAYALTRDGVYDGLSIGFEVLEYHFERDDEGEVIVYDRIRVREVSLVPFPAYSTAVVTEVRHKETNRKETLLMGNENPTAVTAEDMTELREGLADVQRSITVLTDRPAGYEQPVADTRSAGQILKAIVAGDADVIREYNELQERAYEGGTTADAVIKPGWVGDLTRLFDASSGVLADVFSTGTLPAEGNSIEYAQLKSNTITVTEQAEEGDDISMGKVALETKTATVKTYAGGTELSRKSIERATVSVVNTSLNALAIAAGVRKKLVLRAAFNALVASQTTAEDTIEIAALATAGAGDWLDAVVDAAINFEGKGAVIDALIVAPAVFKALNKLETDGHRIFRVDGDARTVGSLDLRGLKGDLASLPVLADTAATGTSAAFVNGLALRQYDSALVSLSDDKISNLTKQFAVYRYGAVAPEIPGFVVPVEFAA